MIVGPDEVKLHSRRSDDLLSRDGLIFLLCVFPKVSMSSGATTPGTQSALVMYGAFPLALIQ
jgi:hypothetical protein